MKDVKTWRLPAVPSKVFEYVDALLAALPEEHRTDAVRMGLTEALGNAVVHGALRLGSRDDMGLDEFVQAVIDAEDMRYCRMVHIMMECDDRAGVKLVIDDCGRGFDFEKVQAREGRGLDFIRSAFARTEYDREGRRLVLTLWGASC